LHCAGAYSNAAAVANGSALSCARERWHAALVHSDAEPVNSCAAQPRKPEALPVILKEENVQHRWYEQGGSSTSSMAPQFENFVQRTSGRLRSRLTRNFADIFRGPGGREIFAKAPLRSIRIAGAASRGEPRYQKLFRGAIVF